MKVISANIDGLEGARERGFFEWLSAQDADVVCLQELNASVISPRFMAWLSTQGFELASSLPLKGRKGSGVAILSRTGFEDIQRYDGTPLAERAQIISATVRGVHIASVYVSWGNEEQERFQFSRCFEQIEARCPLSLIAGDFNILAERHDSHNWYGESFNGYRPDERIWLQSILRSWHDAARLALPVERSSPLYTWWSNRGTCYEDNRGTRLDYLLASASLAKRVIPQSGKVVRDKFRGRRMTDHAPIIVDFDIN